MLRSVARVVRSGLPPPFRPDLWINRVGAPRTGLRPFALPCSDAAGVVLCTLGPRAYKAVHKKHNTRRFGRPLFGGPGRSGRGIGPNCVLRLAHSVRLWAGEPEFLL